MTSGTTASRRRGATVRSPRWTYRQDGKLMRHELPGGLVWEYEYDERGNRIHWWNNDGEEFFAQFDAHNNCVREEQVIDTVRRRGADLPI